MIRRSREYFISPPTPVRHAESLLDGDTSGEYNRRPYLILPVVFIHFLWNYKSEGWVWNIHERMIVGLENSCEYAPDRDAILGRTIL